MSGLLPSFADYDRIIRQSRQLEEDKQRYDKAVDSVKDKFKECAEELRTRMFNVQAQFWLSKAKLSSALCTRRAGKSEGAKIEMLATALDVPNANVLYGTITKDKARAICWKSLLREISRCGLRPCLRGDLTTFEEADYKTDDVRMEIFFKNGAKIKLTGFDSTDKEMDKVLGEPYDLVILDEVQSFRGNISDLVYKRLYITVAERRGRIKMIGTPGDVRMGFFYEVNCTDVRQKLPWELHKWSWKDNIGVSTHESTKGLLMCDIFRQELEEIIALNPEFILTPEYHQEWLGEYFIDTENLIYRFDPAKNIGDPPTIIEHAILGVDLGWQDESAFVVLGWSDSSPLLHELHSFKASKMDLDEVAMKVMELRERYPQIFQTVVDSANAQGIQTIENRYHLQLISADKYGKFEHIRLLNTDLQRGRIKCLEGSEWAIEMLKLKRKYRFNAGENGKVVEDPRAANHLCDAALYAYLQCRQYWYKEVVVDLTDKSSRKYQSDLERQNRLSRDKQTETNYYDGEVDLWSSWATSDY
jgi:hypothetical protein